ncbi:hypothetical protein DE146DRAFT_632060 [Phaeosphaeria sp. MPI-PUGE-AT-0046c]|nr:hypothetical protein DE146DRAFT_632060 [Phaeosphaeria sp. MPI-PUGE-AT-0046c]
MSGLNPFCDAPENLGKENETPDLEEFGYSKSHTTSTCPDLQQHSPSKESPSRRVKLIGSLKRIGSIRNIRSSPLKERGQEQAGCISDGGSPRTPGCGIKPSLALNFQESPPDQPIFEVIRRRRSLSSSQGVQHSSPIPIPTPIRQECTPLCETGQRECLPPGTIPSSPAPLRTALEKESTPFELAPDCSPARRFIQQHSTAMPTPMPGTNLGFSDQDLRQKYQGDPSSSHPPSEPSGYFSMPAGEILPPIGLEDTPASCNKHLYDITQDSSPNNSIYACYAEVTRDLLYESPASLRKTRQHNCNPTQARCIDHHCDKQQAHDEGNRRDSHIPSRAGDRDSADSCSSALNIEHIVFDNASDCSLPKDEHHDETSRVGQIHKNSGSDTLVRIPVHALPQPPTRSDVNEKSAHDCWGTKGSLYDGTGYGDASSSSSTRPSISSLVPESAAAFTGEESRVPHTLVHGAVAIAREHDKLEDAIRAYAALEAKCAAGLSEEVLEDMVAEVHADVELANDIADHSLGA